MLPGLDRHSITAYVERSRSKLEYEDGTDDYLNLPDMGIDERQADRNHLLDWVYNIMRIVILAPR